MQKVIITGVTGQDGSYMVEHLLEKGYEVYGTVRRSAKPDLSNLKNSLGKSCFKLEVCDLSDGSSVDSLIQEVKPNYFINLAAQSFVGSSWKIPEQTFDINAGAVIRILESLHKHSPSCRFYNAGSSEEFGDVQYAPQDEKHPARARSIYGASKIAARQIVKVYRESYGMYAIQGTLFNHESQRRGDEFVTRKISHGIAKIATHRPDAGTVQPIVLGNLDSKRDWSHAKDFVDGIWRMLNQDDFRDDICDLIRDYDKTGHILLPRHCNPAWLELVARNAREYVLSSDETHSVREFIEEGFKVAGVKIVDTNLQRTEPSIGQHSGHQVNYTLEDGTPVVVVSREFYRPAEVDLLHGNSSKARQELQWKPEINFTKLVRLMVENDIQALTE